MAEAATQGDNWAKEQLERAAIKRCSYCHESDHNSASCEKKFRDELDTKMGEWAVCLAGIRIIERLKIGPGSLIFGPLMFGYGNYAFDKDMDGNPTQVYENANYVIEKIDLTCMNVCSEKPNNIFVNTLSEPTNPKYRFHSVVSIPGLLEELYCSDKKFEAGIKNWERRYMRYDGPRKALARMNEKELFQVLHEATEEEIAMVVSKTMVSRPEIVDFTDRKEYQTFMRKKAKSLKQELTEDIFGN